MGTELVTTRGALLVAALLFVPATLHGATLTADPNANPGEPGYYRDLVNQLQPGDTLVLPAGTYEERLNLSNLQGTAEAWITITGPESGPPAIITTQSNCCNAVQLGSSWFVAIKHLTIDSNSVAVATAIDGINAKGGITHDILIEDCTLVGLSYHQQTVGISTKSTAWNWTVRRNTILEAGTGMYFGNSTGSSPFIASIIENNLVVDTIGYNIQIKYQNPYTQPAGLPAGPHRTIIRNNVLIKSKAQSEWPPSRVDGPRPNLLVGGFPGTGPGSQDLYEIYANFVFMNPNEALFQGSGRMTIHGNVFVANGGSAVRLQNHDLPLKLAHVYSNTIYAADYGIRFASSAQEDDAIVGNLVFAATPISGSYTAGNLRDNLTDTVANAGSHVENPSLALGQMDFYPLPGGAQGSPLDLSSFAADTHFDLDFNGDSKGDFQFRGAYAGEGANPGGNSTRT